MILGSFRYFAVFAFGAILLATVSIDARAEIIGPARIVDGDTLVVRNVKIRLHGIDAPERKQFCQTSAGDYPCGQSATRALDKLIGSSVVRCVEQDRDRYGRVVAVCHAGPTNLNAALVRQGWALAYRRYSKDFVGGEADAKNNKRGLWAGRFKAPWDWRKERRQKKTSQPATVRASNGCLIKGNINRRGDRIFHVPGGRSYKQTRINEAKGERWFCTEIEAESAGWRRSRQ
jgi:endonuclease YncB( thermonuclease family)